MGREPVGITQVVTQMVTQVVEKEQDTGSVQVPEVGCVRAILVYMAHSW